MKCIIYDNYNLWDDYADDCREILEEEWPRREITDDDIWNMIYLEEEFNWKGDLASLNKFFSGNHFLLMGTVGLWTGNHAAGTVFDDFEKMFYEAAEDCRYWKLWDEDGHFYFECSHHDGTNCFEIRRLTDKGYEFIDEWNYNWSDKRSEKEVHTIVWEDETMSELPYYAKKVYGC